MVTWNVVDREGWKMKINLSTEICENIKNLYRNKNIFYEDEKDIRKTENIHIL